ncbi:SIMPL domain-containing protein [Aestuariivirga sp.]|uniref:SIMPL domain-containing protein n=1 Tax=Aestuariivirga sp. TaxID=2650926 RepID=UPI0039E36ADD
MLRTLLAASTLALAAVMVTPAMADTVVASPRTISLSGHGEVRVAPDRATVTIGVASQKDTAAEAMKDNSAAMQQVFAALKAAGIAEKDMQTSNFSVQPRYNYPNDGSAPTLVGYDVSNNVTITVKKLDTLGAVLDAVVKAGSNQIQGVSFDASSPQAAMDEARKDAVADALRKAKVYAGASNVTIGNILSIEEGAVFRPRPVVMMQAKVMRADAAPAPIAEGEQTLAVDVSITWEIK